MLLQIYILVKSRLISSTTLTYVMLLLSPFPLSSSNLLVGYGYDGVNVMYAGGSLH
jgi:hypothetical protein